MSFDDPSSLPYDTVPTTSAPGYLRQYTPAYKTFIKEAIVESLIASFSQHYDPEVRDAKIAIDYTDSDFHLPAVIIKFNEQKLPNAGVGHYEYLPTPGQDLNTLPANEVQYSEYQHRYYQGNIEFDIYALSSATRDLISDALVEVLAMDEVSGPGVAFLNRFYNQSALTPYSPWHFPTLNTDQIDPMGESTEMAPWNPEDQLVYKTGYQIIVFGEFYSLVPPTETGTGLITEVDVYPYTDGDTPPAEAQPDQYYDYKGFLPGEETVPDGD